MLVYNAVIVSKLLYGLASLESTYAPLTPIPLEFPELPANISQTPGHRDSVKRPFLGGVLVSGFLIITI